MREELLALLEAQRQVPDAAAAAGFNYKALGGELVVASVFVRVFIEQPGYAVQDPAAFCKVSAADLARGREERGCHWMGVNVFSEGDYAHVSEGRSLCAVRLRVSSC